MNDWWVRHAGALQAVPLAIKQAIASFGWHVSTPLRRPGCVVLMYHRIGRKGDPFPHLDAVHFRCQLEWLAANCDVTRPDGIREAVHRSSGTRQPVVLTFDDGTRDYHDLAYPMLKEFGMPAVVFPITDYVDNPRLLWWDRLHLAVQSARVDRLWLPWRPERCLPVGGPHNDRVIGECKRHLKSVPDEMQARLMDALVRSLGDPPLPDVGRPMMTWNEVRATMDLTTYGGHTHTHPLMSKIDTSRMEDEIRMCRDRITAETGVRPTLFAYPGGDFTSGAKALLHKYGFDVAFTTADGLADRTTDWLEVRRVGVGKIVPTVWMLAESWTFAPRIVEGAA